jgi:hypothetical protein
VTPLRLAEWFGIRRLWAATKSSTGENDCWLQHEVPNLGGLAQNAAKWGCCNPQASPGRRAASSVARGSLDGSSNCRIGRVRRDRRASIPSFRIL